MKTTITITIIDDTSLEELGTHGITADDAANLFKKGFTDIVGETIHPQARFEVTAVVEDNTKEARENGSK
ncbi:MAG: hypothetical protein J6V15_06790 [Clostridia bacterium]|nr:hypothetical protein [Clostridia bacterium]